MFHRILLAGSLGAIFVAVSEFWFYQISEEVSSIGILLAYALIAYLFLAILTTFRIESLSGVVIAAGLFGFFVEGLPVAVLYSAIPFTILWTSLAWHALIAVLVGWLWYRLVLHRGSIKQVVLYNLTLGLSLGIWGAYMWNASEDAAGTLTYSWHEPTAFMTQFAIGFILFLGGHLVGNLVMNQNMVVGKWEWLILLTLAILAYVAQLITIFPFALILIPLVLISVWALRKESVQSNQPGSVYLAKVKISYGRWILSGLIPVSAWLGYSVMYWYKIEIETNAIVILVTAPVIIYLWTRSLLRLLRKKTEFKSS